MRNYSKKTNSKSSFYRLIAATLTISGVSSLLPYLAIAQVVPPTPANTQILNRASGTYVDPNNPLIPINATSNTVTVTVAEVAGITNVPAGIIDVNGGSVSLGDVVNFDFLVTNTGNAPSNIVFPAVANITTVGLSTAPGPGTLEYRLDLNNDGDFQDLGEGLQTGSFTTTTPIPAGSSVRVRVVGTVTAAAAGAPVSVRLGDTGANDNTAGTQNQPDSGAEPPLTTGTDPVAGAAEIRTVNVAPDAPVNGEREASAIQATTVATAVRNIALATVLKARTAYSPGLTNAVTDDLLTYRLNLRVATTSPNPAQFTPTSLEGTTEVNVDGANQTRILVSDVIPAGTRIDETFNAAANLPAGWQAVYQYTATAAGTIPIVSTAPGALPEAEWSTTAPTAGTAPTVVRVGFIFTGILAPGFTTELVANAFQFRVITVNLPSTGGVINNIAQVFGETVGDPTDRVVYDESGDQNPNNFEGVTPPAPEGTLFTPTTDNGVPNPATQSTDPNNNNTGTGPGGEVNIFPIVPAGGILNGPNNVPGAIGRTDNNDDFTNRSTGLTAPQSIPGEPAAVLFDPPPIIFNNTFQNPPSNTINLDTVRLLPLPPSDLSVPLASRQPNGDIPDGTRVTITFGTQIAVYDYTAAGGYVFNAGLSSGLPLDSTSILVNALAPGVLNNYTVTLDLPLGPQNTLLSVDRFVTAEAATPGTGASRAGFNVPIVAFVDSDIDGNFDFSATPPNDAIFNITIDRGYTGYVRLRKQSQVLQGTNPRPVIAPNGTLDELDKTAEPGNIVRYVVEYVNFSTPLAGAGSVVLDAANLVITENGATAPNNWAGVSLHFNNPAVVGGFAQNTFASQGTVTYDGAAIPDPATGTAITTYVNNVGTIQPATNPAIFQGVFRFHRQLQ